MQILQPYNLNNITINELLKNGSIIGDTNENFPWHATIFPNSSDIETLEYYDRDRIITKIEDNLFSEYTIVNSIKSYINNNGNKKRIWCSEFGDFNNSIKRYVQLNKPVSYSVDAKIFLNLPDTSQKSKLNVKLTESEMVFNPTGIKIPKDKPSTFSSEINHPFITEPTSNNQIFKYNNKGVILEVLKWGKEQGINYIYCIKEHRPYVINTEYVSNCVYYTIIGSK